MLNMPSQKQVRNRCSLGPFPVSSQSQSQAQVPFTIILDGIFNGGHLKNTKFSEWHMMTLCIPSITCKELGSDSVQVHYWTCTREQ